MVDRAPDLNEWVKRYGLPATMAVKVRHLACISLC